MKVSDLKGIEKNMPYVVDRDLEGREGRSIRAHRITGYLIQI